VFAKKTLFCGLKFSGKPKGGPKKHLGPGRKQISFRGGNLFPKRGRFHTSPYVLRTFKTSRLSLLLFSIIL